MTQDQNLLCRKIIIITSTPIFFHIFNSHPYTFFSSTPPQSHHNTNSEFNPNLIDSYNQIHLFLLLRWSRGSLPPIVRSVRQGKILRFLYIWRLLLFGDFVNFCHADMRGYWFVLFRGPFYVILLQNYVFASRVFPCLSYLRKKIASRVYN